MRCPTLNELPPPPPGRTGWPWTEESPQLPDTMPNGRPWPRVSIVTPSYNQAQFIEETIRSVLLQGYPDLEYIIIDGGSTDGSVEIIRKYAPWLAYWVSEPDRGQSHAINKGFAQATGEIVAWLNSDDVYRPAVLREVAIQFAIHTECGLIYADSCFIDENSQVTKSIETAQYDLESLVLSHVYLPQQSTFVRARVLTEVGLLDEDLHYAMDFDLWLRVITAYPYCRASGVWSGYRLAAGTKTVAQSYRFWPEIAHILQKRDLSTRIPPDLHRRALREAQFIAGLHLVCGGELTTGVASLSKSFTHDGYPFGSLLNCVYVAIDHLKRFVPDPNNASVAENLEKMHSYVSECGDRKLYDFLVATRMFYSYLEGDLSSSSKWGIIGWLSSPDFRRSRKLVATTLKSLLGPRLLNWGRRLRRRRYGSKVVYA